MGYSGRRAQVAGPGPTCFPWKTQVGTVFSATWQWGEQPFRKLGLETLSPVLLADGPEKQGRTPFPHRARDAG